MKKQIALAIAQVKETPYFDYQQAVQNAFIEFFAKAYPKQWNDKKEAEFRAACN